MQREKINRDRQIPIEIIQALRLIEAPHFFPYGQK